MVRVPEAIATVLSVFQILFAQQWRWQKAQVMLVRAILCHEQRTVSRVLPVVELGQERHYGNYYRILSRVGWSGLAGAQMLLAMLIVCLVENQMVVIGIDETLERRWSKRIWGWGFAAMG